MNISRKGLVLRLLVLSLVLYQVYTAPTSNEKKTDIISNATKEEKKVNEKVNNAETDIEDDLNDTDFNETDRNETESNETDSKFLACSLLMFQKLGKDAKTLARIEGKEKEVRQTRDAKIKAIMMVKCNATLPDDLVEKVKLFSSEQIDCCIRQKP